MQNSKSLELLITYASLASGALVSVLLSQPGKMFFADFSFLWGSQLTVLFILWIFSVIFRFKSLTLPFYAGVSLVLAVYLFVFDWWIFSINKSEGLAWLGYYFSLPGAVIGGFFAVARFKPRPALVIAAFAAAYVFAGIAVAQMFSCQFVMKCGG